MTTAPPDKPAEFTASDILSADAWTGRAPKPVLGIDVVCTKIAVDFQNMHRDAVDECLQLFGGWGYMSEYPIGRAYVDARIVKIAGGSIEIMKTIIARQMYSQRGYDIQRNGSAS